MVSPISATHLKRWVEENARLFDPPLKTNRVLAQGTDFMVMVLRGPNARLDFHREPGDEFFFQIEGTIALHLKSGSERRQVVEIGKGEVFLCPGGIAHSPRRGEGTFGLVIERRRKPEETEEFLWFCERCDELVLSKTVTQDGVAQQVRSIYEAFNADPLIRTCGRCGYVFPPSPMAERLSFLGVR